MQASFSQLYMPITDHRNIIIQYLSTVPDKKDHTTLSFFSYHICRHSWRYVTNHFNKITLRRRSPWRGGLWRTVLFIIKKYIAPAIPVCCVLLAITNSRKATHHTFTSSVILWLRAWCRCMFLLCSRSYGEREFFCGFLVLPCMSKFIVRKPWAVSGQS